MTEIGKKIAVLITDEFENFEFTSLAEAYSKASHEVVTIEMQAGKVVNGKQSKAEVTSLTPDDLPAFNCEALRTLNAA